MEKEQEKNISTPVERVDARRKISGSERYIDDMDFDGLIHARLYTSDVSRARIKSVRLPELPEGYVIVSWKDVPGKNRVKMINDDWPFLAEDEVNYYGEPIFVVAGPEPEKIEEILSKIHVEYQELPPVYTIEDALEASGESDGWLFADYTIRKGDYESVEKAFGREPGKYRVIEGTYSTGLQEHAYLEPQGMVATYRDGKVTIFGSMQCPYYVKGALVQALGLPEDRVQIVQTTTGGGFGGKEDYPSLLAGYVAFAAIKSGKPVKIVLDRREDIRLTTKRHPSLAHVKSILDENNRVVGMDVDIVLDGGAYEGLSSVVLQRSIFVATGAYDIPNVRVRGRAVRTNNVPRGAFRGFGGPQGIFAIEMQMDRIARELGLDPADFKAAHFLGKGDSTVTGGVIRSDVKLDEMLELAKRMSSYEEKRSNRSNRSNRRPFHGRGISVFIHGCGFTGSGERDKIKARVGLRELPDGKVALLVANVEMGQGAQTTLRKIVSDTLDIPISSVVYDNPDTDRVPDSGPTVASRTAMIVGGLVREASLEFKSVLEDRVVGSAESAPGEPLKQPEEPIEVFKQYRQPPEISWDDEKFIGDAYPDYSWGVNVVDVSVDPVTREVTVEGIWGVYDIGVPLDEAIARGQMQGGIAQGIGWASLEVMEEREGRLVQDSLTDYIIPTSMDLPDIEVDFVMNPSPYGPYGAKGAGELPFVGIAPAYAAAVSDALGVPMDSIPITPEKLLNLKFNKGEEPESA